MRKIKEFNMMTRIKHKVQHFSNILFFPVRFVVNQTTKRSHSLALAAAALPFHHLSQSFMVSVCHSMFACLSNAILPGKVGHTHAAPALSTECQ